MAGRRRRRRRRGGPGFALAHPLTALPALGAAGLAATLYFTGAFTGMTETLKESWGGVVDAIRAGDLELAWKVAIKGGEALWVGFRNWMLGIWDGVVLGRRFAANNIEGDWVNLITNLKELARLREIDRRHKPNLPRSRLVRLAEERAANDAANNDLVNGVVKAQLAKVAPGKRS